MRISAVAALMIITTVLLSACEQKQMAAIEDKGTQYYGRDMAMAPRFTNTTYQAASIDSILSTPIAAPSAPIAAKPMPVVQNTASVLSTASSGWSWPVNGRVTENFGKQSAGIANEGITIAAAEGTPIRAASGGEVAYVGSNVRDYGNMVIVRHPSGQLTSYAHAKEILVSKGDKVMNGDVLGYVGQSGNAKSPQLHFAMREGDRAIDPLSKLPQNYASR